MADCNARLRSAVLVAQADRSVAPEPGTAVTWCGAAARLVAECWTGSKARPGIASGARAQAMLAGFMKLVGTTKPLARSRAI